MTWNYRVVRQTACGETIYGIHEAYYEKAALQSVTVRPVGIVGDSVDELRRALNAMTQALGKPAIDDETLQEL